MKKILYRYSNGEEKEHTCYIKSKTIKKESNGAKVVDIYEKKHKTRNSMFWISRQPKRICDTL